MPENIPPDYCDANPSSMIGYQTRKIQRHVQDYDDCYLPFLMPWYGTGVLASGFGVPVKFLDRMDPAVNLATIREVQQLKDLKRPDPEKDGLMPRVLDTIRTMRRRSDLPVGVTDCQGPLTTALQIVGYDKLIYWMYDHPDAIHDLMQQVTDSLIDWVRLKGGRRPGHRRRRLRARREDSRRLRRVWISDDDSVIFVHDLYREFVRPYNSQVLRAFGGGAIHYCGNSNQHIDDYLATDGLTAIQKPQPRRSRGAARMRHALAEKGIVYITADFNLDDDYIDAYYEMLFRKMGTRGLVVAAYIAPAISLAKGRYTPAHRDPQRTGRMIERAIVKHNG